MQHRPAISGTQGTRDDIEPARSQSQLAPPQARTRSCVHNRSYDCATGRGALSFDWTADRDGVIDGRLSPTAAVGLAAVADYAGGDAGEVRTALVLGLPAAHEYRENGSQMDQSSASAGRWRAQCGSHLASASRSELSMCPPSRRKREATSANLVGGNGPPAHSDVSSGSRPPRSASMQQRLYFWPEPQGHGSLRAVRAFLGLARAARPA